MIGQCRRQKRIKLSFFLGIVLLENGFNRAEQITSTIGRKSVKMDMFMWYFMREQQVDSGLNHAGTPAQIDFMISPLPMRGYRG